MDSGVRAYEEFYSGEKDERVAMFFHEWNERKNLERHLDGILS